MRDMRKSEIVWIAFRAYFVFMAITFFLWVIGGFYVFFTRETG
jgi:hypothetical protein